MMASDAGYIRLWKDANVSPPLLSCSQRRPVDHPTVSSGGITRVGLQLGEDCLTTSSSVNFGWKGCPSKPEKQKRRPHSAVTQRRTASATSRLESCRKRGGAGGGGGAQTNSSSHAALPSTARSPHHQALHSPLPPRCHSSLGFRESSSYRRKGHSLPRPQGFDLQAYILRQGSANNIRICINGSSSSDEYFEKYLEECESAAQQEKREWSGLPDSPRQDAESLWDDEGGGCVSSSKSSNDATMTMTSSESKHVPLCWDDQLRKAKPDCILPRKKEIKQLVISRAYLHQPQQNRNTQLTKMDARQVRLLIKKISVSIKWRDKKIFPKTPLTQLTPQTQLMQTQEASIKCVIPSAEVLEEEEVEEGEEKGVWHKVPEEKDRGTKDWRITDLEATPPDDVSANSTALLNIAATLSNHDNSPPVNSDTMLRMHFHCPNHNTLKEFSSLLFKASVIAPQHVASHTPGFTHQGSFPPITTGAVKARVISRTECVMNIACGSAHSDSVRVLVACWNPRVLVLSTSVSFIATPPSPRSPPPAPPTSPFHYGGEKAGSGYRDDQDAISSAEEDEDRTDLNALVERFPDLQMGELINSSGDCPTSPLPSPSLPFSFQPHPFILRAYGTLPLGAMATRQPSSTGGRSLYRPGTTGQTCQTSYGSIVEKQLRQYVS